MGRCTLWAMIGIAGMLHAAAAQAVPGGLEPPPVSQARDPAYAAGLDAWTQGDWPRVIAHMAEAIEHRPWNDNAHNLMGFAFRKLGDFERSLAHYGEALNLNPHHRGALQYLGEAYLEMGHPQRATQVLERLALECGHLASVSPEASLSECSEWGQLNAALEAHSESPGEPGRTLPDPVAWPLPGLEPSAAVNTARVRVSERGRYRIGYRSRLEPIPINRMHQWVVHLETLGGEPVESAEISVTGGMPEHDHGLPTAARITRYLGNGEYLLEGLKFHMSGWWEVSLQIDAGDRRDTVTFNLVLSPEQTPGPHVWSAAERATLRSLWLGNLPPPPPDPTNGVADDPRAAKLGQRIFFDPRFSANGQVACASCHRPERNFTDGLPRAQALGTARRKTMTIVGAAYSPWFFWDGRKDSQWSQALGPLENPVEHGANRLQLVHLIATDPVYRRGFEALFGPLREFSDRRRFPPQAGPVADPVAAAAWEAMAPEDREVVNRTFANMGKVIAAYERRIMPGLSRFDTYVEALVEADTEAMGRALGDAEITGLRLFIGKGQCIRCHSGPLFTNHEFHNTGVPQASESTPDRGRSEGIRLARADPFNCLGPYRDGEERECAELRFARSGDAVLDGAFKTPTLRNVAATAPYMHAGQFATLGEVLTHYNLAEPGAIGHNEAQPLGLSATEIDALEAFLESLSAPLATQRAWLDTP